MANEQTTTLDAESRALMERAQAAKADLTLGRDVVVPTGDEAVPLPRVRPDDARKAIIAKRDTLLAEEVRTGNQRIQPETTPVVEPQPHAPAPAAPPTSVQPSVQATPPSQPLSDYVNVTFQGKPIQVSRRDIERSGGVDTYLRTRELTAQSDQLAIERAELERARFEVQRTVEEARRLQEELRVAASRPAQGAPASPPGTASRQVDPATGRPGDSGEDIQAKIEEVAAMFWSGDREDVAKAVREIIDTAASRGQPLSPDDVADRALARLRAEQAQAGVPGNPPPQPPQQSYPVNTVQERMYTRINTMADNEYPALVADPVQRTAALQLLQQMAMDPKNQDRDAVDIARDACESITMQFNNPRREVQDLKRGLPAVPSAGGVAPAPAEDTAPTPGEIVAAFQASRRFGPR